jgi:DNA-directed RNA polymerase subunit RPC12/RpoP
VQPSPPGQGRVYGFRCLRCGNGLELPADLRIMAIDCPYCGQDNLLPPEIVQARQRQYALDQQHYALQIQEQERLRVAQERDKVRKQSSQRLLIWLMVGGFFALCLIGSCIAIGMYAQKDEAEAKARAQDPKINGHAAILARLAELQKKGCSRILIQPAMKVKETSKISLDMIKNDSCVHILGFTAAGATLSMKYEDNVALTVPLPAPAPSVDYRLCASQTATHAFKIDATPEEPFTTAVIECPRTPAEGGARSTKDDPKRTGKERVQGVLDELVKAGCKNVVSEPKVTQGDESLTITSPNDAACYNLLAASFFSDVKLTAVLKDPEGKQLPVPDPDSKLRIEYCAPKAGEYKLSLSPSTGDFYAFAGVDCSRFGPEGLKRLKKLAK